MAINMVKGPANRRNADMLPHIAMDLSYARNTMHGFLRLFSLCSVCNVRSRLVWGRGGGGLYAKFRRNFSAPPDSFGGP